MAENRWVTVLFKDTDSAGEACQALIERGYSADEIAVIMSDETCAAHLGKLEDLGHKAEVGGAVGALAGAVAATGAALAAPGIGLVVAGPLLAASVAGAGAGATLGTLVGGIAGFDPAVAHHHSLERGIRTGGVVIGVRPHSDEDETQFRQRWADRLAEQLIQQVAST
ncbi:MAG: hypothetical protein QM639_10465 [Rhodocyclaceae bacterium]